MKQPIYTISSATGYAYHDNIIDITKLISGNQDDGLRITVSEKMYKSLDMILNIYIRVSM